MNIAILYEDAHCLVVSKPNNVLVHHSHYARNIEAPSLVELLREQGYPQVFPVHRLDHKTSGVLLLAKEQAFVKDFQELFTLGAITKRYCALLRGHVDAAGELTTPVKNERGNYKEAHTVYRTLEHYELAIPVVPYPSSRYSLVEMQPLTGRMHQLRIHANKMSHPIIGDPKYGNRHHNHMFADTLGLSQLFLHARSLVFRHPFSGEAVNVEAPLPGHWEQFAREAAPKNV